MRITGAILLRWFVFFFAFLLVSKVSGQSLFNPDSLQKVLDSDVPFTEQYKAIQVLAESFMQTDPGRSLGYGIILLEKAKKSGNMPTVAEAFRIKARACLALGSYDSSIVYCDSGIILASGSGDIVNQAELTLTKSNALYYSKGPEAGIRSFIESYRLFESAKDSAGLSKALNGMGVMYKKMAQYDSAVNCYLNLVTLAEKNGYESTLGLGYLNLGILYQDLGKYDDASHYLRLSIPINEKYRHDLVALAHMNIGLIHFEKNDFESALSELKIALKGYLLSGTKNNLADLYNNLGYVFYNTKQLDSAYHYFLAAKEIYQQIEFWYPYGQVINNLALVQIDKGNHEKGLNMLDSCLILAKETANTELEALVYYNRYHAYDQKKDYRLALKNYLIHDSLQEIIYNLDKEKIIADLEMKYQSEKKQAQILALEKNNLEKDLALQIRTKQRNAYLFSGIGIIALITFAFLYFTLKARKDKIIARQKIRQLEEEKKLLAAKFLVEGQEEERKRIARELHDGLGVLLSTTRMQFSSIHDKSPENQELIEKATRLLEQAASDVRKISHNMMPGLLTRLGLFEAVADLFDKLAETEGLNVRADIPENAERMAENKEIMIYRIIQELVNNTLKHSAARNIELQMQVLPGRLDIIYTDDGKGFNVEEKMESKSIGLQSIQSRVNFLNGIMQLYSEPGKGVSYKLEIPV